MKPNKKRNKHGRTKEAVNLIHKQSKICLRYRALYSAAKKAGLIEQWLELITAKLLWLHIDELRKDQSKRLLKAAKKRDELVASNG